MKDVLFQPCETTVKESTRGLAGWGTEGQPACLASSGILAVQHRMHSKGIPRETRHGEINYALGLFGQTSCQKTCAS